MNIRTKLSLALVAISIASMALLGTFAYYTASGMLKQVSMQKLDALAESKKRDLTKLFVSWQDQVRLIRSRTQLRISLDEYQRTRQQASLQRMTRILDDAMQAVSGIRRIALFDTAGSVVVALGRAGIPAGEAPRLSDDNVHYRGSYPVGENEVRVVFVSRLKLDDEVIGAIEVVSDARELLSVTSNYTGLGETGESFVVIRTGDGFRYLNPLRHEAPAGAMTRDALPDHVEAALIGTDTVFRDGVVDYRGEPVWAAVRLVDGLDWGLVVKADADQEQALSDDLFGALVDLALALSAFAVIGGTLLGFWLARPISELAEIVQRVRGGESDLRAEATAEDEIGYLAESINDLLDHQETHES